MEGSKDAGVFRVMSLAIWSRLRPTDSFAAILAIGKPVALEARAEERETLGFISMIISCTVRNSQADCCLAHPGAARDTSGTCRWAHPNSCMLHSLTRSRDLDLLGGLSWQLVARHAEDTPKNKAKKEL